jgi:hypothetical protein
LRRREPATVLSEIANPQLQQSAVVGAVKTRALRFSKGLWAPVCGVHGSGGVHGLPQSASGFGGGSVLGRDGPVSASEWAWVETE